MKHIDFAFRTIYAELSQRCQDDAFIADFSAEGRFVPMVKDGRKYWYFDRPGVNGTKQRKYVGPDHDASIRERVEKFAELKSNAKDRRSLVRSLVNHARLPGPDRFTGDIIQAMAEAGFFRMRGVLVGTVAFHCYSGLLGVELPSVHMQTTDTDFAQFHSISNSVGDQMPPILDVLRKVDLTFAEVMHSMNGRKHSQFANRERYKVEFLTPNRGSDENAAEPARMASLGSTGAQPLRFLDFLIHEPVRAVLLHKAGSSILVPSPERYALHKLIVSSRRKSDAESCGINKAEKDVHQATILMDALVSTRRCDDLALAFDEAWIRGGAWREALKRGFSSIKEDRIRKRIIEGLVEGLEEIGESARYDGALFSV